MTLNLLVILASNLMSKNKHKHIKIITIIQSFIIKEGSINLKLNRKIGKNMI
jgi:hypothetical protein